MQSREVQGIRASLALAARAADALDDGRLYDQAALLARMLEHVEAVAENVIALRARLAAAEAPPRATRGPGGGP